MLEPTADSTGAELLVRLCGLADKSARCALLPVVGCRLLLSRPLDSDLQPSANEDVSGDIQSNWIDGQLYHCLPCQSELESLGDAQFSAMQSSWPEGFQWVVFDGGEEDESHARGLIESYLEWADRFTLPIMTDFDVKQEEMDEQLTEEFVRMIRGWREAVISRWSKISKP
ncbi:MAG: hypothetical protein K8T91_05995 [Planctomycetes bacterium]|nr:hypothetical protein [Planctomycetota bacterium]